MPVIGTYLTVITVAVLFFAACNTKSGKSFVPANSAYPEKQKQVYVLNDELLEISGIASLGNNKLAAVNDEDGKLFILEPGNDSIASYRFRGKGDYEDLVKTDSAYFIMSSNGNLYEVNFPSQLRATYKFRKKKKMEFESLVWYAKLNKLVLITKEQRNKKAGITAFSFDLSTRQFDPDPFFTIPFKEIFTKLEDYNAECKPSGAALNPVNGNLYIIASIGKLLMECSPEGHLLKIYKLNPNHFPQPEGIAFAGNGDMYISNEGIEGKATILKYTYVASQ